MWGTGVRKKSSTVYKKGLKGERVTKIKTEHISRANEIKLFRARKVCRGIQK